MKIGSFLVGASVVLAAGLGLGMSDASAWDSPVRSSERIQERIVPHGFFKLPEPQPAEWRNRNGARRFIVPNRPFGAGTFVGVYAPPLAIGSDPGYGPMEDPTAGYGAPPIYGAQPVYAQPVNTVYATPAAPPMPPPPPMPTVVEYPMGRFELRGDGMTSPYNWVWIPNPPPPPPVAAPTGGPFYAPPGAAYGPPGPVLSEDRPSLDRPSFSSRRLYRWTDENGVINVTDRLDAVPLKYRSQIAQTPPS